MTSLMSLSSKKLRKSSNVGSHHTPMLITEVCSCYFLSLLKNIAIFVESIYHYQDFQSYLLFPASDFFDEGLLTSSSSNVDNNIVYGIV